MRHPSHGARFVIVVALVGLVVGGVLLDRTEPDRTPSGAAGAARVAGATGVPGADALSASWYCAEGTARPGRAEETVVIGNLSTRSVRAVVTVFGGEGVAPVSRRYAIASLSQLRVPVSSIVITDDVGVQVELFGGQAVVEHELRGAGDLAVGECARRASPTWYFAAGTTVRGAEEYLALFNPFNDDAIVDVTAYTDTGIQAPAEMQGIVVPRRSRITVAVHDVVRRQALVGLAVRARLGRIVAERSHRYDGTDGRSGLSVSLGVVAPEQRWDIPVGDAGDGVNTAVVIVNYGTEPVRVLVTSSLGTAELAPERVELAGGSIATVDPASRLPAGSTYSVVVAGRSGAKVVAEAAGLAPTGRVGAATMLGAPRPSKRWAFAAARTPESGNRILVANPTSRPLTAELLVYTPGATSGPTSAPAIAIPPGGRVEFDLDALGVGSDRVAVVQADGPIVAGRSVDGGVLAWALGSPMGR